MTPLVSSDSLVKQRHFALPLPACGERVGAEGRLRWPQNCGAQNRGEAPSPSLRCDLSPHAGRGEKAISFSQRAFARECGHASNEKPRKRFARRTDLRQSMPAVVTGILTINALSHDM